MEGRIDEVHNPKRATDFSWSARASTFVVRWSPLIVLGYSFLSWALLASGFGWNTPKERADTLEAKIDRNRIAAVISLDSLTKTVGGMEIQGGRVLDILEIISMDMCLRRRADPYIYRRLKCDELLRGVNP